MKKNPSTSAFIAVVLIMSLASFIYVNFATSHIDYVSIQTQKEQIEQKEDSKLPDLKFVKTVLNVVEKFLPAK